MPPDATDKSPQLVCCRETTCVMRLAQAQRALSKSENMDIVDTMDKDIRSSKLSCREAYLPFQLTPVHKVHICPSCPFISRLVRSDFCQLHLTKVRRRTSCDFCQPHRWCEKYVNCNSKCSISSKLR